MRNFIVLIFLMNLYYAKANNSLLLKNITITHNLDSLENVISNKKIDNEQDYIKSVLTLEFSRFFYSSWKFGYNLPSIKEYILKSKNENFEPYYKLFWGIDEFRYKKALDTALNIFYSVIPTFQKSKDTLALIITYSRLMDIQISYSDGNNSNLGNLVDEYYKKSQLLVQGSNNPYYLLYFYFSSIRYNYYWQSNYKSLTSIVNQGLELINESKDNNIKSNTSYFYYYKSVLFLNDKNIDSAIYYLKKSISKHHKQAANNIIDYLKLIEVLHRNNLNDSAYKYLNIVELNISKKHTSLNEWVTFYNLKSLILWNQKQYENAWASRFKVDSVLKALNNELYKIPIDKLNKEFKSINLQLKNEAIEKQNFINKLVLFFAILLLILVSCFGLVLKRKNSKLYNLLSFKSKVNTIISHDFKSPLYALQDLYAQANYLIKNNNIEQLKELSDNIDKSSINMGNLLLNLQIWSTQKAVLISNENKQEINLNEVVDETIELYTQILANKKIILINNLEANINVFINKQILGLILRNWIDNLLKHSNATEIKICNNKKGAKNEILITDNGLIETIDIQKIITQLKHKKFDFEFKTSTGLGLSLISYFSNLFNWNIEYKQVDELNHFAITIT